ncbi:type VI secretion system Vgr family protein [Paludisphaera soli]|uniref:type VI secretion system Vgr family protein n=1 Tax=Paludisphaera soli TaxID=2712865 RepID=UPI0013EC991C|nr:type VI secretion system tip protein TssI/VgrG [Paludisphaera soli]
MAGYVQANRPLTITTPLGPDRLFLVGLRGSEALSQLFRFQFDLIAEHETDVPFDQLLGKKVTGHVNAPGGGVRHFSGVCNRIVQGGRDATFTTYHMDVVPEAWFLTRRTQSRIFQQVGVPEILKKVFSGLPVQYQLKGKYEPRDYCVQYRESDFDFASRLMEEEGIFYFFTHAEGGHTMIVADQPAAHQDVPFDTSVTYEAIEGTALKEDRMTLLEKSQDLRPMKVVLWDHCFELPHKHLEVEKLIQDSVQVGDVSHKLKIGNPSQLELYDWPGGYAQRFDGVDPGRGDRPSDVQKIFQDNQRTAQIRIQEEAADAVQLAGASRFRQFTAGHVFNLKEHFNANGAYVLTSVSHSARMTGNYRSGDFDETVYENSFTCIPCAVPFRPRRVTPKPVVHGTQTAVVVGPKGEELYTDKYGRVKVQFHWDREGKNDQNSSCWIRVAQPIAGKRWGGSFWPRIGQEVVVDHLEGDVDQPIIIGTVYNAEQMPPYLGKGPDSKHNDDNLVSGFKSNTSKGGQGYNEFRFFDAKDKQQIFLHAERDYDARVKNDCIEWVQHDRHSIVGKEDEKNEAGDHSEEIWRDHNALVHRNRVEHVEGNVELFIGGGPGGGNHDVQIEGSRTESVVRDQHLTVGGERQEKIGTTHVTEAGQELHLKGGMKVVIEAGMELVIKAAGGFVKIDATGVTIEGTMVKINCGGGTGSAKSASPKKPKKAAPRKPKEADDAKTGDKSCS